MTYKASESPLKTHALSVRDFSVFYRTDHGPVAGVQHVGFDLGMGQRLAVVGESGSGKTTLAMALAGLLPGETADIEYEQAEIAGSQVKARRKPGVLPRKTPGVSMVFQDAMTSLDPVATIGHQFNTVLPSRKEKKDEGRSLAVEWIAKVGIPEPERVLKLRPYELSGGMRQRIMIALALCGSPQVLIADEPTSALDASVSRTIMDLMTDLCTDLGSALIIITHDIALARHYTDKTLVLYRGAVQDLCNSDELESSERSSYTRALVRCVPRLSQCNLDYLPTLDRMMAEAAASSASGEEN
ncbi:MAG: ABC transporter ATP-binding protein [Bifidobacterium tibiigranuli]|jgi:ABC-type dipeptide/oligopeptide/nickel transport system ATPase component|uniref:ATP-binding cassette domain-containing protein n=1 Tax=Bifidobacterium tibiigranuli TaxID=2172043 RepID=UPI0026EDAEF3|nr:ABC transporter ATP-binding protein [Bifidobacterium tibiigranuli]MCI1673681.1 ABC transporter ATP-binding protein [Bifidobacterium tibiigranuli]MCI1712937.1 ABC transporter ATP-binding protein [Bifidobacterium tibiigranuli]MCI1833556.1 ABC transporter ATP-binding protein [Bifidobacterium tibiigranuli]